VDRFLDIAGESYSPRGEQLCGSCFKAARLADRTIVVLADGLGSGVKANILATLTTEIVIAMSRMDRPLVEILPTIAGTLPASQDGRSVYSTFTILEVRHPDWSFHIINYGNPAPYYLRGARLAFLDTRTDELLGKPVVFQHGSLLARDYVGLGTGGLFVPGQDWASLGRHIEESLVRFPSSSRLIVHDVMRGVRERQEGACGNDATFVGGYLRARNSLVVFTGPPRDATNDTLCVLKFLGFHGTKVVCGGTTGNIVANHLGEQVETDLSTERDGISPIAEIRGVGLVTEGIRTLAGALEYLKACAGESSRLSGDRNGAVLLAAELLRADFTYFLVGQAVNPAYQNPLLPKNISIRRSLVDELAQFLRSIHKEVEVECW
jgi:hypothetical protein